MANYLDDLASFTNAAIVKIAQQRALLYTAREAGDIGQEYIDNITWWGQLLNGSNDTSLTEALRLRLLTLLVNNARLNPVVPVDIITLYQPFIFTSTATAAIWGGITGNINDQTDLIAKFDTYLPLAGGTMTGNIIFANNLGIDVAAGVGTKTLYIGQNNADVIQFGTDAEVRLGVIAAGEWNGDRIGVAYGGLGALNIASGTNGQAIVKNGSVYAFADIPVIPDLSIYALKSGTTFTGSVLMAAGGARFDSATATQLLIGSTTATSVRVDDIIVTDQTITNAIWDGNVISLAKGGTDSIMSVPAYDGFFFWDNVTGGAIFGKLGSNLSYDGSDTINLAATLTGVAWGGTAIPIAKGGSGQVAVGSALQVLRTNAGATGTEWATLTALTNPMTLRGSIIYGGVAANPTELLGNTTTTPQVLISTGSAGLATDPVFGPLTAAMIPDIAISQVTSLQGILDTKLGEELSDGLIWIGNTSNAAVPRLFSGAISISNEGDTSINANYVEWSMVQFITTGVLLGRWQNTDGEVQQITLSADFLLNTGTGVLSLAAPAAPVLTTKGDLLTFDTAQARLPIGGNATMLMADSGVSTGNKWIALSGDATIATTGVITIGAGVVSLAKMANIATASFIGRTTAGTGVPEALSVTQATAMLNLFATGATTKGLVPGSNSLGATYYLDGTGNWSVPSGGGGGGGANTALSNLSGVAINASLIAGAAGTLNLGSALLPWADIHISGTSGTPATNNFKITGASTSGLRTITLPDASITVAGQINTSFTSVTSVTVTHNLGKYPAVQVIDNAGLVLSPTSITHNSVNDFSVVFSTSTTGNIITVG